MFFAQRELAVNPPADVILEPPNCRARWLGHFIYLFIFFWGVGGVVPTRET